MKSDLFKSFMLNKETCCVNCKYLKYIITFKDEILGLAMGRKHSNKSPFLKRGKIRARREAKMESRHSVRASGGRNNEHLPSLFDPANQYIVRGVRFTKPSYDGGIDEVVACQIADTVSVAARQSKKDNAIVRVEASYQSTKGETATNSFYAKKGQIYLSSGKKLG